MSLPSLWIPDVSLQDIHSQGEVIACLEKALVREVEQQDRAHPIKEECQKAILRVAELSSDDFHLDRHLYFSCRDDRERFCQNVRRLYRCLHDVHAFGDQTQTVNAFRKYGNYTWTGFSWFPTVETQAVWGWQIPLTSQSGNPFLLFSTDSGRRRESLQVSVQSQVWRGHVGKGTTISFIHLVPRRGWQGCTIVIDETL